MYSQQRTLRCVLMGTNSRLIQCGEILLGKHHQILAVICAEPALQRWAKVKSPRVIPPTASLAVELASEPFDYLFSIDNPWVVTKEVIVLARRLAINFHDAPLPRYAGVNATNWAIMGGETIHGVTWHIMTDQIDAGDVVKRVDFEISDRETALSLNTRCYEKSIEAFADLVDDLAEDRVTTLKQNLGNRTYFPRWLRPAAACTIDWRLSAEEIDALVRGLEYGPYPNPIGLPKLRLADQVIVVRGTEILPAKSTAAPGTITGLTAEGLRVATTTREIALTGFSSLEGERVPTSSLMNTSGLQLGKQLPKLEEELSSTITRINSGLCRHEAYWAERLAHLEVLEIPLRNPPGSPSESSHILSKCPIAGTGVPLTLMGSAIPGDVHLAAMALYLSRISGMEHFDVGYRHCGLERDLSGSESYFASYIPLRIDIDDHETFRESCARIRERADTSQVHGSYARDLVCRDPRIREASKRLGGLSLGVVLDRIQRTSEREPVVMADLVVTIPDDGNGVTWWFDQAVYDRRAIDRMKEQYAALLDGIAEAGDRPISDLSILPGEEAVKIAEWNNTHVDYPMEVLLHQLFEAQVARSPDAIAVALGDQVLSYSQLDSRANQLAHHLRRLRIMPDSLVGVCMERSLEMVVALYAVLKAGGAYVPIDPGYPSERVAFMLADSAVPVILTQSWLIDRLPLGNGRIICLDTGWEAIAGERTDKPDELANAANLAYMIYTSGSTGKPKGAMNTHRGICNRLLWMQDRYSLTEMDKVLQKTPFSFDVSVWEFFWPLLAGARLVLAAPGGHRDSAYLVNLIREQQITVAHFVPSMLRIFLEEPGVESCRSLRHVICSGEALSVELQERFFELLSAELHNLYGPTEAAVDVTSWTCQRNAERKIVPIGRPIANTQVYVLDRCLQPVPVGVPGELYIGGVQVGRGYYNRPSLTEERFIPDPHGGDSHAQLYKTGDLCRWLEDGSVEYLGRMDFQVKIRGFRIELGEIEAVLDEHPMVKRCLVAAREDMPGERNLVAYVVWQPGNAPSVSELRDHLMRKLPDHMVPSAFMSLDEIPMAPNGKVDRRALPSPSKDALAGARTTGSVPDDEVERTIAKIWQEVLGISRVDRDSNFFDLGGDSLRLMRVRVRLQQAFHKEVTMLDLLQGTTIKSLAGHIRGSAGVTKTSRQSFAEIEKRRDAATDRRQSRRRILGGEGSRKNESTTEQ